MTSVLATRFASSAVCLRSPVPLTDDQIRVAAPSIFALEKHASRSERYAYVPTIEVLRALRAEGFAPLMVAQTRVRDETRRAHTKHLLRLRPPGATDAESANEVILLNSHDGSSSYQMLAGLFRFVCVNGLVCGDVLADVRVPHKGDIADRVVAGAHDIVEGFGLIRERREAMRSVALSEDESAAFARAALALRYDPAPGRPAPVTDTQLLAPRRAEDTRSDLWTTFNRVQENLLRGGLAGRTATGRRTRTRAVEAIDRNVQLNRALWVLAEEMGRLKR